MGELLKKPYEISIWEDRLVTENDISYYKEIKLAVIGSDRMESANRVYDAVLTENVNGEKTLTFSLTYRYFDELRGDFVINPYYKYLLNERKIKLHYNDEWFEFLIKECDESSEDYIFKYTARERFSLELSKTGYNVTLDQSLNNNQGTITELAEKVLEGTDWQVDKENSDLLQQYVQEPLYQCTVESQFSAKDLDTGAHVDIEADEVIYIFYSYINNKTISNVQFIRESDREKFLIDDNNVIRSTNYRFLEDVTYQTAGSQIIGINDNIDIDSLYFQNQGYRLVYGQQTIYDPVMDRTVDLYRAEYEDGYQDIYHYTDYTYTTSDIVASYMTNGTNFNVFEDGTLQGWSNKTPVSAVEDRSVLQPIKLVTRPEIAVTSPLSLIETFGNISGYLQLKFNRVSENYTNTYFNSGFNDNTSLIDHISAGEQFALRLRYYTSEDEHDAVLTAGAPSALDTSAGIRVVVAEYEQVDQLSYLDDNATQESKIKAYKVLPSKIILDFDEAFVASPNLISNGTFNEQYTQYIVDHVVQSPSALYHYKDMNTGEERVWDGDSKKYIEADESYAEYYLTTAKAKTAYSSEQLHDPKLKLGVFLYTKDNNLVDKYVYVQDIQLTRYYENSNGEPVLIGNVPTATSTQNDYFYLKPKGSIQQSEITTYGDLDFLASELGLDSSKIEKIYNEDCEKILSIQVKTSNCFNILQDLCETFECWLQINVEHDDTGAIKLDKDYNPIKKVAFKQYAGKENFSGFKKGINLSTIERQIDSNEIVTKLIVESVQSEYTDSGSVDIQSAPSNPSGESTIINLSYYLNRGLITDVEACNQDLLRYYDDLKGINSQISELNLQNVQAQMALTRLSANRNTFTTLIDEAKESYNEAIQDFYDLTGMDYDQYVIEHNRKLEESSDEEEQRDKELLENDTVLDVIAQIYVATAAINNYTGLLTNLDDEYQQLDLLCNGAKDYAISVTSIPGIEGTVPVYPSTQVVFDDYVSGVRFKLYDGNGSYEVRATSPNDRIFNLTAESPYKYFELISIPDNYQVQYYVQNKKRVIPKESVIGQRFSIVDSVSGETYNRRFKLIPTEDYAEAHIGYEAQIEELIEQKQEIQKEFYRKYSRFLQEGTWSSQDYIDSELYYLDALQVSNTSAQPKVSYTIKVVEVSQLDNLENYDFRIGDKTYIEDTEFFGYLTQSVNYADGAAPLVVSTPVQEEVIVSEVEWHLDKPDENIITIQNYKTQFEDLFQRISATVQTVQRNENTYPKTTAILGANGLINSSLLADSISGLGGNGFALTSNGSVTSTNDGLVIRDLTNSANVMRLASKGVQVSTDGGTTWGTAVSADGISAENLTAGTINTQKIWLMDGNNPSFRWDKAGLNAYGLDENGNQAYDLKTYVRFDKYGLYGIKNDEDYVASSLNDVRDKAYFGVTWDGFFIKNSYTDGEVSITSDDDIVVKKGDIKKIHIGAIEKNNAGAPTEYGIKIRNDNGDVVFETGDDGNLSVTGTINALQGNFSGQVSVGNPNSNHIIIDGREDNPTISSSNYENNSGQGWIINGDGDATFSNVSVRGAIKTAVFEYEEIQAVGGAFLFRPSSTIKTARFEPSTITVIGEDGEPMDVDSYYHYVDGEKVYNDLLVTVEKPLMFKEGNWVKISNYNSDEAASTDDLTPYGLVHVYKVIDISNPPTEPSGSEESEEIPSDEALAYEITLKGGAAILETVSLEDIPGGALIDFGNELGTQNYGIGINSSDNYVNLPARAISLFETTIHPNSSVKVSYNYRGILGTLPRFATDEISSIYPTYMEGKQGIYTDNMYIGDKNQYIAFYKDNNGNSQLRLVAKSFEILPDDSDLPIDLGDSIVDQKVQYTLSTSDITNTLEEDWSDIPYEVTEGYYQWQRTYIKYAKGRIDYLPSETGYYMSSEAGQPGPQGPPGPQGEDAVNLIIDSSNGNTFKNSSVNTQLNVTIFKGTTIINNLVDLQAAFGSTAYLQWYWKRMGDSTFSELLSTDSMLSNGGFTLTLTPDKVDVKVVFQCEIKTIES